MHRPELAWAVVKALRPPVPPAPVPRGLCGAASGSETLCRHSNDTPETAFRQGKSTAAPKFLGDNLLILRLEFLWINPETSMFRLLCAGITAIDAGADAPRRILQLQISLFRKIDSEMGDSRGMLKEHITRVGTHV